LFLGWSTTPNGEVDYVDEDDVWNLAPAGDEIPLYAVWKKTIEVVHVSLVVPGEDITSANANVEPGLGYSVESTVWRNSAGTILTVPNLFASNTVYTVTIVLNANNDHIFMPDINAFINTSIEVYNIENDSHKMTLTYTFVYFVEYYKNDDEAEGIMEPCVLFWGIDQQLKENTFTKTNYTFVGWSTTPNGIKVYDDKATVFNITPAGSTIKLYAVWCQDFEGTGPIYRLPNFIAEN